MAWLTSTATPTALFEHQQEEARMRSTISMCSAFAVLLTGCATAVEQRVESGLTDAGVPAEMASCMADIWTERLSVSQIRGISRFAGDLKEEGRTLTVGRLIDHVREWNDPEALGVVTGSASRCALSELGSSV